MSSDVLGEVAMALDGIAPFVLFPAAVGAAIAGVLRRRRLTIILLMIAIAAVIVPLVVGMLWLLSQPPT